MSDVIDMFATCGRHSLGAIAVFMLLLLLELVMAIPVQAGELVIPDRARLQALSQEEYSSYRQQLQSRVDRMGLGERNFVREPTQVGARDVRSGYGQGYGSRHSMAGSLSLKKHITGN